MAQAGIAQVGFAQATQTNLWWLLATIGVFALIGLIGWWLTVRGRKRRYAAAQAQLAATGGVRPQAEKFARLADVPAMISDDDGHIPPFKGTVYGENHRVIDV